MYVYYGENTPSTHEVIMILYHRKCTLADPLPTMVIFFQIAEYKSYCTPPQGKQCITITIAPYYKNNYLTCMVEYHSLSKQCIIHLCMYTALVQYLALTTCDNRSTIQVILDNIIILLLFII